ncbi:uncharacterized protein LOC111601194 isoform X2 [Drosophila hydei]|uniref:Uncharacterized protein LOC111601194 isoform X2 n=1 Tax=Drosophila hydei TaxID=7224 RepID=A0A6J1M0X1_DROHY|nr:uncharacterized protein LOC111601194 isoform X2 [Drosophila hydei]
MYKEFLSKFVRFAVMENTKSSVEESQTPGEIEQNEKTQKTEEAEDDEDNTSQTDEDARLDLSFETTEYLKFLKRKLKSYPLHIKNIIKLEIKRILSGADNGLLEKPEDINCPE